MPSPLSGLRVLRDLRGEKVFRRISVIIDRLKKIAQATKPLNYSNRESSGPFDHGVFWFLAFQHTNHFFGSAPLTALRSFKRHRTEMGG
jgi:hypothetical protein